MIDIEKISNSVPEGNGYIGEDGLLHCKICGEALETFINVPLKGQRKVRCICSCIKKERDAFEERTKAENIDRNRRICFDGSQMMHCTFETSNDSEYLTMAKNYVKNFDEFRKTGKGLLLYGEVGTGKSHIAACIANALLSDEKKVLMTNFMAIVNKLQEGFEGRTEYIKSFDRYTLLIIDDLGAERRSEYMQENVYNIVDARYRSGLPLIVTTNLTAEELKKPTDIGNSRIYDRILEKCHPINVKGQSRRRQNLQSDFRATEKLLKGD